MNLALEILRIVLPVIVTSGIGVFVILRMKHKYTNGTLGKKKTKNAQSFLNSLMPLGMVFGAAFAVLLSMLSQIPLLAAMAWGPGIGFLFGYFAYEIYSKREESHS